MEEFIVISSDSEADDSEVRSDSVCVFTPTKRPPSPDFSDKDSDDDVDQKEERCPPPYMPCKKRIKFEDVASGSSSSTIEYYCGDRQLPIYSRATSGYPFDQLVKILMPSNVDESTFCSVRPVGVSANATFIVDIDKVHFSDLKCDDLGTWTATGTKSTFFRFAASGIKISEKKPSQSGVYHVLTRRYFVHGTYNLYHRIIVDIQDNHGARNKLALVQYMFDGPEIEVISKPHGNSKGSTPYFRTSDSARQKLQTLAVTQTPKTVIERVTREAGGELNLENPSDAPRNRQQISNIRRSTTGRDKNVLYSVMLECKATQGSENMFVRDVKAAPSPQCVLFFDWQLQDMRRFLTNNKNFGIFTADTTYNLGEFYVTPTAYPQLMLEDVRSKQHPTMVGPILVHQQTDFASFNYFASTLISHNKQLRNILCFGSDGDKALVEAFSHSFPFAIQLRCFIHFRRNIQEKLRTLGIPHQVAEEFLTDILGKQHGSTYIEGLTDCRSEQEFDEKLQALEQTWNERELPYCPSSGPRFYSSFCRYQAEIVKHHMRRDVREAVGLGCPPSCFTTNSSESLNASIKQKVDYKQHEWPQFNKLIREFVMAQRDEVIRSLSGRGQYRLTIEFSHLAISLNNWSKMTAAQRKKIVNDFDSAVISRSGTASLALPAVTTASLALTATSSAASSSSSTSLSVSAEDSGILTIPFVTLQGMWEKAERLLSSQTEITHAPGSDPKARMVLSLTSDTPHFVRCKENGQYICDSACIRWTSANMCSHTLAVAEMNGELLKFLQWYSASGSTPNISILAMQGLPSGRGRKGGQAKRKRKKESSVPETLVSVNKSPPPPPPPGQSQGHCSGSVNVASGASSHVTVTLPHSLPPPLIRMGSASPPGLSPADVNLFPPTGPPQLPNVNPFSPPGLSRPPNMNPCAPPGPPNVNPPTLSQPPNVNPFYVKFIAGNIRICQGCKGSLKTSDNRIPTPPFDIAAARSENRPFRDASGNLITPKRATVYHYHCRPQCIQAVEPHFILSSLLVPADVGAKLTLVHKQHLAALFNITFN